MWSMHIQICLSHYSSNTEEMKTVGMARTMTEKTWTTYWQENHQSEMMKEEQRNKLNEEFHSYKLGQPKRKPEYRIT